MINESDRLKHQGLFLYIEENYSDDKLMAVWADQLKQILSDREELYMKMSNRCNYLYYC